MAFQIVKTTQSLTTAEDMRNQTKLVMQPYANWEEYLTPAPLSIAILGELVFISSQTDFSINKNPPKNGYKHIKYPDSFRACLMQVCNSGWWAFNEAHKNMDQIRLHTMTVPDHMKSAVKILFQGNDEVVQAHLPDQLENIRVIADDCLALAGSTEQRFTDVINIIQELLEACVNAEHFYGEELEEIKKKLEENKMRKQTSDEAVKRSKKALKAMEKALDEAQEDYKAAMDSLPSGWDMIGMDIAEAMTESISNIVTGMTSVIASPANLMRNTLKLTNPETLKDVKKLKDSADGVDKINIYSKSAEILKWAERIQQFVQQNDIDWKSLYDQKKKTANTMFLKEQFIRINNSLQKNPTCNAKKRAQEICKEAIAICDEMATYAPEGKCEEATTKQLIQKIRNLTESAQAFDSKSKDVTKSPSLTPKPPMMFKEESQSEKISAFQRATENARFRIEQSRAQLNNTRETYEKSVENMEKNQKELTEILISMRNCEVKEIDFNTTIQMLVKGMDAMGRVKEQWEKMVRFFQMVSNIVKTSLTRTLKNFVSTAEKTQSLSYNSKLFSKDLLYNQAFQATNIASLVHMISATYTDISEKYLMDRVSSLGKLMTMDKEKPQFKQERLKLQKSCDEAQKGILRLVRKNKDEFERKTNARLEKIDKELLAILPEADPEVVKSIKAAVESGFTEEEEGAYI
ncbi:myosin-11-like [Astyanax mexicanus]|uniref:myosin-11-like n=1 Tax=Astyanax mexicanus TaxID=7994 RepID=UPI0020CAFD82|nr:myosin-11-like [Astyanax mexicanus]